jgi:hypothetical protein
MRNGRVESLPVYRVFGNKYQNYYTILDAADEFQAVDLANALPETEWNSIPTDDVIEATDVYLNEDTSYNVQLNI